jgi:hypothetical protein
MTNYGNTWWFKGYSMNLKTWRLGVLAVNIVFASSAFALDQTPTPQMTPLTVDETTTPIRVDGHLNDWPSARMILLNQPSQATLGKSYWKGEDDFSGRIFLTYDSQYLYLSAIVKKAGKIVSPKDKASLWNGDCLELFFSIQPFSPGHKRLLSGDYRIGLSPGADCKNPQVFCFSKNAEIPSSRLVSRKTRNGYLMEASLPLYFFEGLEIAPGKKAAFAVVLDKGGSISVNRTIQLAYPGKALSPENPSSWGEIQWIGKTTVSIAQAKVDDFSSSQLEDGTNGSTFFGFKTIQGKVLDPLGKPLAGAKVSTWPKTAEAVTDANGQFQLEKVKVYDQTVIYGRRDGYTPSLSPFEPKEAAATIHLQATPKGFDLVSDEVSPFFYGKTVNVRALGGAGTITGAASDLAKNFQPEVLRLAGAEKMGDSREARFQVLDQFVSYARQAGAEPILEVPLRPETPGEAAEWVRHCNVEKKYNVRFWAVGNEPDRYAEKTNDPALKDYTVYDYINDFRDLYNQMKKVDPSIIVLGPELAWKYKSGDDDWLGPFLQANGDIADMITLHRYAVLKAGQCTPQAIKDALPEEAGFFQVIKDKISQNSDIYIPLAVTGGSICAEPVTLKALDNEPTTGFWEAVWEAQEMGMLLKESVGMDLFSPPGEGSALEVKSENQAPSPDWALRLLSPRMRGKVIPAQVEMPDIFAFATQDAKTRDVALVIINKGDRYVRPKILFNGKEADLMVDAGLDQRLDYEAPSYSINCLRIKADRSNGDAVVYTIKMAQAGKAPEVSVIKPW